MFCIIQFANDSFGKYREINKISLSYETKMTKSNLNTVLYAVIAVSYGKENFKVFTKICLFCYLHHGEKREKSVAGHESDKLIESYSAQPTTEQQFESYSINRRFKSLTQVNSGQYKWALLFLLPFPSMTSLSFHHPQQQIQQIRLFANCSRLVSFCVSSL